MRGQAADVPDDRRPVAAGGRARGEEIGVHAERDQRGPARQALALADAAGLAVADAQPGGVAQRPAFEPPEGDGVALVDVLCGVEDVRRPLAAQPAQQQDLGRGERERLLLDVDDVVGAAEGPPEGERGVDEERGVPSPGAQTGDGLARTGLQPDVRTALVPAFGGQQIDLDTP